jgi:hypothetical protein
MAVILLTQRLATAVARGAAVRAAAHATATSLLSNFLRVAAALAALGLVLELGELGFRTVANRKRFARRMKPAEAAAVQDPSGIVQRHVDVDKLCPLRSHTPDGTSANPCGLCVGLHSFGEEDEEAGLTEREMIRLGHVKRTLPCGHVFHAICVDRIFLRSGEGEGEDGSSTLQCPTCHEPVLPYDA